MAEEKSKGQLLAERLLFSPKNCWEGIGENEEKEIEGFAAQYKQFLDDGKTERECVTISCELLEKNGFVNIENFDTEKTPLQPGAKIYQNIRGKSLLAAVIGKTPSSEGVNILGSHVDSPRLDLKQNPLYEDSDFALLDTHYYGGIKKYQWTAIPLAMHGVFVLQDGKKITVKLGENSGDPVFTITDLLPHLAQDQMEKKGSEVVEGENLDILAGSRPYADSSKDIKDKVKLGVLAILNEKYGITEKDFASAEIQFVPAFKASDVGFDRSMIGAYGHDDRCCAFPSLKALAAIANEKEPPAKTLVCYLSDKEETGSGGNTGARSASFTDFLTILCGGKESALRRCCNRSFMLSTDVNVAFDPTYASVYDKKNVSYVGKGIVFTKYTGARGKYGASDANAEFCAKVQCIMDKNSIKWQMGQLGKVDKGGAGTIAVYAAILGIDVIDCGIPVLSMHSPFEIISKIDLFTTYKGYIAFLKDA